MSHPRLQVLDAPPPVEVSAEARERLRTRNPCPGLWKTPVIRWDGQLMACCADVNGEIPLGNLRDADFEDIWDGPLMTRYRMWHIEGSFWNMPKCLNCGGINYHKFDAGDVHEYLERKGRLDLWGEYRERLGVEG